MKPRLIYCAMKDESAARRQFEKHVFGNGVPRHRVRGKNGGTK